MSAIHWPIADISKIFEYCFLLHYRTHNVSYALAFFQKLKKFGIYELKFFKLQQYQYFALIFNQSNLLS